MGQQGNPFYVAPMMATADPGGKFMTGMQLRAGMEEREAAAAEAARKEEGRAAWQSAQTDAERLQVMQNYPELAEAARADMKFRSDQTKESYSNTYQGLYNAPDQAQALKILQQHIQTVKAAGGDATDSMQDLQWLTEAPRSAQEIKDRAKLNLHGTEQGLEYLSKIQEAEDKGLADDPILKMKARRQDVADRMENGPRKQQILADFDARIKQEETKGTQNAALDTFNAQLQGLSPEDQAKARRIALGLDPRQVMKGDSVSMVGNVPYLVTTDDKGETVVKPMSLETGMVLDAAAVGENKGTVASGEEAGKNAQKASEEARAMINGARANAAIYDQAIAAIDQGATSGQIMNRFPTWSNATTLLENAKYKMGIQQINAATFGALSEKELELALATGMPPLDGPALRDWLVAKKNAEQKLAGEMEKMAYFLATPGNTKNDWMDIQKGDAARKKAQGNANPGDALVEKYRTK